jgi:hypothetical protein
MAKERTSPKIKSFEKIKDVDSFKKLIKGSRGLALDIDDTLALTFGYWVEAIKTRFGDPENLTAEELIIKYKQAQFVPYWQTPEALQFMENLRVQDSIQTKIPLIENSNEIVRKINEIIPILAYLTNRPKSIYPGTKRFLKKHKFLNLPVIFGPGGPNQTEGAKWKAKVLKRLYPEIIGIIDDSSSLIKELEPDYQGIIFHYNHQEKFSKKLNIIPCNKWANVLTEVKKYVDNNPTII